VVLKEQVPSNVIYTELGIYNFGHKRPFQNTAVVNSSSKWWESASIYNAYGKTRECSISLITSSKTPEGKELSV
jgi:hypothetical protein